MWLHCTYYDMRKVVCYIETKKVVKNVANIIVITYAVLTKSHHKFPCNLTSNLLKKKHRQCVIMSFILVHEGWCAWPSSECVTLFCALQVVSSDLFNSISIFKAKQKNKNGQTKKRKREFLMNYTISVKPDSRKAVPEKKKIFLSTHFN